MKKYLPQSNEGNHLFLNGGDRIYYPEDLLPAVDASSPAGKAIAEHVVARENYESVAWLGTAGSVVSAVGLVGMLGSLGALVLPVDESAQMPIWLAAFAGGSGIAVAGVGIMLLPLVIAGDDAEKAAESADRAGRTYLQSLSDRLGVHVDGDGNIVDSTGLPPTAPVPKKPGQAEL
jgi:hypothetical protein